MEAESISCMLFVFLFGFLTLATCNDRNINNSNISSGITTSFNTTASTTFIKNNQSSTQHIKDSPNQFSNNQARGYDRDGREFQNGGRPKAYNKQAIANSDVKDFQNGGRSKPYNKQVREKIDVEGNRKEREFQNGGRSKPYNNQARENINIERNRKERDFRNGGRPKPYNNQARENIDIERNRKEREFQNGGRPNPYDSEPMKCNGFPELCDLDITQVTLAGSHNSGAGAYGWMKHQTRVAESLASNCFYRTQRKSFYDQLKMGLRYFDIDPCWAEARTAGAWICNKPAYAGPVRVMFKEIDQWMNEPRNRNEVVVIHFTRDYQAKNKDLIASDIQRQLLVLWEPDDVRLSNKKLTMQTDMHVKLSESIRRNQRIYIIMHQQLILGEQPWLIPHWNVGYTWLHMKFVGSKGCKELMSKMTGGRCQREAARDFLRYDLYLSAGLCNYDLAKYCRKYIRYGVHKCSEAAWTRKGTVNFIVVDFADQMVVQAAKCQNFRNIKNYLGTKSKEFVSEDYIDCT